MGWCWTWRRNDGAALIRQLILLGLSGAALLALTLAGLQHVPDSAAGYLLVVRILCVSAFVYLVTVWFVLRWVEPKGAIWLVLLVAVALRLPLLLSPPILSSDVYRYVWDGRVQAAGINPYRYVPDDPALASLRDISLFPHINRADYAPTIYPPAAQFVFGLVGRIWPTVTGMKLAMVGFEALAIGCLWRMLALAGLPRSRLLIYAWNPLPAWAFAGNGHVDAMVGGLVALALLLRVRRSDGWAGLALGLAFTTKFLPAVMAPALWRRDGGWRLALVAVMSVLGLYGLYSGVGWRVFGFLAGYGREEGLDSGAGFWVLSVLASLGPLPSFAAAAYMALVVVVLAVLGGWVAFVRRPDDPVSIAGCAGALMAVLTFGISPHYPWYFAWLAVPAVLAPNPALLWLSSAPVLIYLAGYGDSLLWPSVLYVPALVLGLLSARTGCRRNRSMEHDDVGHRNRARAA
jgi:alpha-1,6-mannosyltransferase